MLVFYNDKQGMPQVINMALVKRLESLGGASLRGKRRIRAHFDRKEDACCIFTGTPDECRRLMLRLSGCEQKVGREPTQETDISEKLRLLMDSGGPAEGPPGVAGGAVVTQARADLTEIQRLRQQIEDLEMSGLELAEADLNASDDMDDPQYSLLDRDDKDAAEDCFDRAYKSHRNWWSDHRRQLTEWRLKLRELLQESTS